MKKLAISYYFDMRQPLPYSGIRIHQSGKEAMEQIVKDAKSIFKMPVIYKAKLKVPFTIGFAFRYLGVRFLEPYEVALYKSFGDKVGFNQKNGQLCELKNNDKR